MLLDLRNSIETEEFDYNFLTTVLSHYKNPRVKIHDLLKNGHIIRVKKGLYVFGPKLSRGPHYKETLANLIFGPSYISLEYALSFYGLIPDRVEIVTSVTNKRKKHFKTPVGEFSFSYINPSLYSYGITLYEFDQQHSVLIASKEKALADYLYFCKKLIDENELERFLIESVRIDILELKTFNLKKAKTLAKMYGHNVMLLHTFLENLK
ncbi:MAG: type IV toxin-antitoxin system AbiEi family antitoxin domain-containing protein [Alphaproteobacteria bacterium]